MEMLSSVWEEGCSEEEKKNRALLLVLESE